jgi:hypothetical protein
MSAGIATAYANYKQYAVRYDLETGTFTVYHAGRGIIIDHAGITEVRLRGEKVFDLGDYREKRSSWSDDLEGTKLTIHYREGPAEQPELTLTFILDLGGIHFSVGCRGDLDFHISGRIHWGDDMAADTFAVCLDRSGPDLRCALGPAASTADNALFDRQKDEALEFFGGARVRLQFDWADKCYRFQLNTEGNDYVRDFSLRVLSQVYERRFGVTYAPINKRSTFPTPPAGWMTWYAVQFAASEKTVLEQAGWQAENLLDYGATALWVDWEWYHSDFSGIGKPDTDSFHPDPERYPNGLQHVAREIEKKGLTPCLWVGFTNDPTENELVRENSDMLLVQKPSWCGQYFLDPGHPDYLATYIPKAFSQVKAWGYKALKWDCLPITLQYLDQYHDSTFTTTLTSEEILHGVFKTAREVVGTDCYMLSCSGHSVRDVTLGADIFDAARIGGDIFTWSEFVSQCVMRIMKFYACHNVLFYNDPDNVVLRPEFNTFDQALSRLSFVALLGLPVTMGDRLTDLSDDRVELLRRGLPPIDAHPMDVRSTVYNDSVIKVNLAIEQPFERWNVVDIMNLGDTQADIRLDLKKDLHLPDGSYLVYDYWAQAGLGTFTTDVPLTIRPFASRVLGIRRKYDHPQIYSTSRHITQGAVDLEQVTWDAAAMTLSGTSQVVKGDAYTITLYVPSRYQPVSTGIMPDNASLSFAGGAVWLLTLRSEKNGQLDWSIAFRSTPAT